MLSALFNSNPMTNARVEEWLQNAEACPSTIAVIQHAEDDGEEEVTSKYTPVKISFWAKFKNFWLVHYNLRRHPFSV